MSLILNIDTALSKACISIAREGRVICARENVSQKEHASFLQPAILNVLNASANSPRQIEAVAVSIGPGSYTGLRVGLASAKGLCYSLQIPLITICTLDIMAFAAQQQVKGVDAWCPMIDARRMEVFTALYGEKLLPILPPQALILDSDSLVDQMEQFSILFFGDGSEKMKKIIFRQHHFKPSIFQNIDIGPGALALLSYRHFSQQKFASLAYAEPLYLKEFQDNSLPKKS
jgi:tRNA threonylcarbamoyladenosine biosynthesis protein TsaB